MNHARPVSEAARRTRRSALPWLLAATLVSACTDAPDPGSAAAPTAPADVVVLDPESLRDAGIATDAARSMQVADAIEAPGVVALDETRTARIGSQVDGKVLRVAAEVGDRVAAGALLATMHSPLVHDAWADYRRALAERRRTEAELAYAVAAAARAGRLLAAGAASLQEVQRAEADRLAAEQGLDMARTDLRRAEEVLEHYGITSGDDPTGESGEVIPVTSPIAGAVLERACSAGGAVTTGTPLFVVSDLAQLWVRADLQETMLRLLRVGSPVRIRVAAYPEETFPATIVFVADTLDPVTRRVGVRCVVDNADGRLRPEMFATVVISAPEPRTVVAVPDAAVQSLDGRPAVFVETAPGRFERRDVTVGASVDGWTEVRTGVAAGERVATSGSILLASELKAGGGED